ncbi:MAG: peptidylprolyl isomerase [Flavobacteriaceae bacterium]|nr:peptidylprolyl isomerase [Flavobacteriaceae bacterium]
MYRLYLFIVVFPLITFSQINDQDILFEINNQPVYAEEFIRVYNKNIELINDESQKDIDNYLELYINYKLKLSDAYLKKIDEKDTYKSELDKYSKQLKSSFLTDKITEEKLILEAYDRTKQEVNVSHILIRIDEGNNDTIKSYNKVLNLRASLLNNNIDSVINTYHNGKDIIIENLGYFSAFKMIYAFENVAYRTRVGEVSMPFRTQFGYHILKVNDKRTSLGEVTVGHIMVSKKKPGAKEKIYSLYDSIAKGSNFESLAKKYSDDKNTSFKGGRLNSFSSGQLNSIEFEDMAFSLNDKNEISSPVETKLGWHIIKLYSKSKLKPIEDMKSILSNKIKRSSRSSIISNSFYQMLLDKYEVNYDNKNLKYFESIINDEYFKNSWLIPDDINENNNLITIGNRTYNFLDFATYISENQGKIKSKNKKNIVFSLYKDFINNSIVEIYKSNLENENKDFKYILKEYKEGLLLFDLMQEKIWNVASKDSIKMKKFYESNKSNYTSFEEDKGEIIGDYQDFLENNWLKKLRKDNMIVINKRILKRIKKILENNE